MELKKYKLGEIATIVNGATPSTSDIDNYDGDIVWLTPKDLSDQDVKYISKGNRNITQKGYDSCSTQMIPPYNILMSSRAPIGLLAINQTECCTNQGFKNIVVDKSICDADFMYYYLKYNIRQIESLGSGTTFKEVSKQSLEKYEVKLPSLQEQRDIAALLSAIDDKIFLNRAINQNLEAMAKQLYDYWFVQFDFPNENGKPYKSCGGKMVWNEKLKREIPEKWHSDNICLIADILSGGTPSKQINEYWNCGHIPFFGPTDYNGSIFQLQTADKITESGLQHCSSSLFEENTIIITARGSIGKLVIVGTPMAMNQSCYALKSKNEEYEYLYFLTIQLIESLKAKGSGSVFKSIIVSDIENTMLCVANKRIISLFCDKVSPIMKQIKKNTQEMIHLIKQRDELLPLLMNGQVSVNSDLSAY